jgi:hypothetical protein
MSEAKTKKSDTSVTGFLDAVENETRRTDAQALLNMMREVTGDKPSMWGPSIVGFGSYHFTYASGREGDWPVVGFSPRKRNLSLYIMDGFDEYEGLLAKLGKHTTGKACLYINKLADVDLAVLRELVAKSVEYMRTNEHGHQA